ncbi:MAG: NYN domain-containing protein [Actinomycetota bacterium]
MRTRIFIDFWNFQLNWNRCSPDYRCDWRKLPRTLLEETSRLLESVSITDAAHLEETLVYASVGPGNPVEQNLRRWLRTFLDRQPSFHVKIRERHARPAEIHCNGCGTRTSACPTCGAPFRRAPEKGVDAAIVTDLLSLAWESALDIAVLVSNDSDFVPAVEHLQAKGLKVINASWPHQGHDLARTCWASFPLDQLTGPLTRPQPSTA